jgi:hypothetical protein
MPGNADRHTTGQHTDLEGLFKMRQSATKPDTSKAAEWDTSLSPEQVSVLEALVRGETVTNAAQGAGVSPRTVHRWLKDDFAFQAAYNRERRALMTAMQQRLTLLAATAIETVEGAVKAGDVKAALAVIKAVGLLSGEASAIGAADPDGLQEERERAERQAAKLRKMDEMFLG